MVTSLAINHFTKIRDHDVSSQQQRGLSVTQTEFFGDRKVQITSGRLVQVYRITLNKPNVSADRCPYKCGS